MKSPVPSSTPDTAAHSFPTLLNLRNGRDMRTFKKLIEEHRTPIIVDDYKEMQKEYFAIRHPKWANTSVFEGKFFDYWIALKKNGDISLHGRWCYFPWNASLVHILEDKNFQMVRTARNRNLITADEQKKFYRARVGIAGLSVGNSAALALVLQGGARRLKIADHDRLALSNLNRVRSSVTHLGTLKTHMTARQIYEINPYAEVECFSDGLTDATISEFFDGLDVVIDEMDNLAMKYRIREHAKKNRIPVVMAADNGDNGVIDIERYDINPAISFFHGRLGETSFSELNSLSKMDIGRAITRLVGPENVTERMQMSLLDIGKTIVSWPQLGGAALLNGSAVAYCVRKIVTGHSLELNRAIVSLDELLIPEFSSPLFRKKRREMTKTFLKNFGL